MAERRMFAKTIIDSDAFLGVIQLEVPEFYAVKNALEKQIPKKPNIPWDTQLEQCPMCQRGLIGQPHYCSVCGQKIDWSAET